MRGGIHPTSGEDKEVTKEKPIRNFVPDEVKMEGNFFVKKGESVKKGEKIGTDFWKIPLHASITGTVREVDETWCMITGKKEDIDKEKKSFPYQEKLMQEISESAEEIIGKIKEAGIVGMGGAGFPTYFKYETKKEITYLLINAAECEPFLTCDERLMIENGYAVLNGILALKKAADAKKAILCIEDNKREAAQFLQELLNPGQELQKENGKKENQDDREIQILLLPTRYPQGGERQLIQTVLKKEVPIGGLPADVGVIVSNVATAKAAADAVFADQPLTERIVTVTGAVEDPGNYLVPIGTPIEMLLELSGGVCEKENKIILGGPMTGKCVAENWNGETLPTVKKTTSGVIAMLFQKEKETPCIRCGACIRACPAGLAPFQIDIAYLDEDEKLCEMLYASECIACGCCSYVCPAKRELTHRIVKAREIVRQKRKERSEKK